MDVNLIKIQKKIFLYILTHVLNMLKSAMLFYFLFF